MPIVAPYGAWRSPISPDIVAGAGVPIMTCRPAGGGVGALVTIACAQRAVRLAIAFEPSGQITGLRVLRPDEAPPC